MAWRLGDHSGGTLHTRCFCLVYNSLFTSPWSTAVASCEKPWLAVHWKPPSIPVVCMRWRFLNVEARQAKGWVAISRFPSDDLCLNSALCQCLNTENTDNRENFNMDLLTFDVPTSDCLTFFPDVTYFEIQRIRRRHGLSILILYIDCGPDMDCEMGLSQNTVYHVPNQTTNVCLITTGMFSIVFSEAKQFPYENIIHNLSSFKFDYSNWVAFWYDQLLNYGCAAIPLRTDDIICLPIVNINTVVENNHNTCLIQPFTCIFDCIFQHRWMFCI